MMKCRVHTFSLPAIGVWLRPCTFRYAIKFILAMVFITASPAQAGQCPREGLSSFCCAQADPHDAKDLSEDGYGWHPSPSDTAGLCQGLASRNVSGGLIQLLDLRETEIPTTMPDSLAIGYRDLPWSLDRPVVFYGAPLTSGNIFFIAGSFETGNKVVWDTRPFSRTGQNLSGFGFVAAAKHMGRIIYTPLVFGEVGAQFADRAKGQLVLRSTETIESAAITIEPLDPNTLDPIGGKRELLHTQPRARMLHAKLSLNLPEAFLISVAICTAGTPSCQATEDSPPTRQFRVFWLNPR